MEGRKERRQIGENVKLSGIEEVKRMKEGELEAAIVFGSTRCIERAMECKCSGKIEARKRRQR